MTYSEKEAARRKLRAAVRAGKVSRPEACEHCGSTEGTLHGHHGDYSRPLDVEWLCGACHRAVHVADGTWKANGRPPRSVDVDPATLARVRETTAAHEAAAARAEQARQVRNAAIVQAIAEGWTHSQVARVTGLTRGRVGQMATTSKETGR